MFSFTRVQRDPELLSNLSTITLICPDRSESQKKKFRFIRDTYIRW